MLSKRIIIRHATKWTGIHFIATDDIDAGLCESLKLAVDQAMAAAKLQPRTKVSNLSFLTLDEEISGFTLTD